ncbi:hypothetical protein [Streptomyces chrestomyceticus]|uniref:Uncharacterized protein n=1 Tax=Streptomyces chrestomyceticus TaxID=68185 RepID=A0ABU7X579_9ACTN
MTATAALSSVFVCPDWCNIEGPLDHFGARSTDVTDVLHMGPSEGMDDLHDVIGWNYHRLAYSLPDGRPGRPFWRISTDGSTCFDVHDADLLRHLQRSAVRTAFHLGEEADLLDQWDTAAAPADQAAHFDAHFTRTTPKSWFQNGHQKAPGR